MEIFKLYGSIFVDADQAKKSISDISKNATELGSKFQKSGKNIANVGKSITKGVMAVGGAFIGGATALGAFASKTADAADEIDKMSQRLGLSRQTYQELDYVLSQAGVDINSFQTGMKSLLKNMDGVSEGNKTATKNFDRLKVSVQNADGSMRSQEEVLLDTIRAFQEMEDSAEKSRLAQELFGKQGQEILPLLNSQAGSMDEMRQKAEEYGLVLSDDAIDAGVKFHDTIDTLKRSFAQVGVVIGAQVIPHVQQFADYCIDNMPTIKENVGAVATSFGKLASSIVGLAKWFGGLSEGGQKLVLALIGIIAAIGPVITVVGNLTKGFGGLMKVFGIVAPFITGTLIPAIVGLGAPFWIIVGAITAVIAIGVLLYKNWDTIKAKAAELKNAVVGKFEEIKTGITSKMEAVKTKVKSIIDTIKGFFKFEWSLPKIKLPHFKIQPNGWKFDDLLKGTIPKLGIEWYAKGGILNRPTVFGMNGNNAMIGGEAGPEAIAPISTLKTYIADAVDTSDMANAINYQTSVLVGAISSLKESGTIKLEDPYNMFKYMRNQARIYQTSTGTGAFEF